MIICPNCGAENHFDGATLCKKCLEPISRRAKHQPKATPQEMPPETDVEPGARQQVLPSGGEWASTVGSEFEIKEVEFDAFSAVQIQGEGEDETRLAMSESETPAVEPEPIEKELTLYRDDEFQVKMEHTEAGPAVTVTNRLDLGSALEDEITKADTIIPGLQDQDRTTSVSAESYDVTKKIMINPIVEKTKRAVPPPVLPPPAVEPNIKIDQEQQPVTAPEKPRPQQLEKLEDKQIRTKSVAFFDRQTVRIPGVRLMAGDELTIGDRVFELKRKPEKRWQFYVMAAAVLLVAIALGALLGGPRSSSDGHLVGIVRHPVSGQPLTEGTVTIKETNQRTTIGPHGFFTFDQLPQGIYTVEVQNAAFGTTTERVTVVKNLTSAVNLAFPVPDAQPENDALQQPPAAPRTEEKKELGTLRLEVAPDTARVYIDGDLAGTGNLTRKLPVGRHRIWIKAKGHTDFNQTVEILANGERTLSVRLQPLEPKVTKSDLDIAEELEAAARFDEAAEFFSKVVRTQPSSIEGYLGLARCYRAKGDNDKALSSYLKAARNAADNRDDQRQLEALSGVLEINPNYLTALYNRGLIYLGFKDYDRAAQDFSKVIEIDPRHLNAHYKLAEAYTKANNYTAALRTYEQTLKLNFTDCRPYAYMAEIYLAMGDTKNARKYYEKFEKNADLTTRNRFEADQEWQNVKAAVGQ